MINQYIEPIKVAATLDKLTTLKDGSFKLIFETQEINRDDGSSLLAMRNSIGWLIFAPDSTKEVVIPEEPVKEFTNDKTPSQRLRAVLYILWNKEYKSQCDFDSFYKSRMEKVINMYKDRLA